jgi:hypothetical protein
MITNLSRNKGFMSNESLNKTHRSNTVNNFNFSSYKNENFLKNECELARREVLLQNQKQQKQTINDNLKSNNHINKPLTIFDINNPTKQSADQHKRSQTSKMMNGFSTNGQQQDGHTKLTSRIDDDIKFIDSDIESSTEMKKRVEKRVDHHQNGIDRSGRHRSCESSELNKITQKILNKNQPEQQARGRDKSKTASIHKVMHTNGSAEEEIKFIDSDDLQQQHLTKLNTNSNTSSLTLSSTPPLPSSLTNSHYPKNHLINNINTKNNINHKCDKLNSNRSNNNHLNSSTESLSIGQHHHQHQPKSSLMEKVESPLKTSTVTVTITPKKSTMAAPSVTSSSSASPTPATGSTCDDVNLTNLLIDNNKFTNKLNDESVSYTYCFFSVVGFLFSYAHQLHSSINPFFKSKFFFFNFRLNLG